MTRPAASVAAEDLYRRLGDGFVQGDAPDWLLLRLCSAIAVPLEPLHELADTDWTLVVDPESAPALPWLAQLVGLRYDSNLTEEENRSRIRTHHQWQRGTPATFRAAIAETLPAGTALTVIERDGGAYKIGVIINAASIPDEALTRLAIKLAKPAGHTVNLSITTGQTYSQAGVTHATYTALAAAYATYNAIP